jgi:TonB family protein
VAIPAFSQAVRYVEVMPEFQGGQTALMAFLSENIRYPELALQHSIEGKVVAQFIVEEDGSIQVDSISFLKMLGYGCEEEVKRVISLMPNWKPGRQNNQTVRVYFNLPVTFRLEEEELPKAGITLPEYIHGENALAEFIQKNLVYPKVARKKNTEGEVILSFLVRADGNTSDVQVFRTLSKECDAEALRIFNLIDYWKPGTREGAAVDMAHQMKVSFYLK